MDNPDCNTACNILSSLVRYLEMVDPASMTAWKTTRNEYHNGYNRACRDILRIIRKSLTDTLAQGDYTFIANLRQDGLQEILERLTRDAE